MTENQDQIKNSVMGTSERLARVWQVDIGTAAITKLVYVRLVDGCDSAGNIEIDRETLKRECQLLPMQLSDALYDLVRRGFIHRKSAVNQYVVDFAKLRGE